MQPSDEALALYRAAARAYRHTRRVLKGQPHDCQFAATEAVKALRPDLDDEAANAWARDAVQWAGQNYPAWFWK